MVNLIGLMSELGYGQAHGYGPNDRPKQIVSRWRVLKAALSPRDSARVVRNRHSLSAVGRNSRNDTHYGNSVIIVFIAGSPAMILRFAQAITIHNQPLE